MTGFIATMTKLLATIQMPSLIIGAIVIAFCGYLIMVGGEEGQRKAKKVGIGVVLGLVCINGALALATLVDSNITF